MDQSETAIDTSIYVGREFTSFKGFQVVLDKTKVSLGERWRIASGGRTVVAQNKKIQDPSRHFPEELKYAYVNFRCIHEGAFVPKGAGKREMQ